MSSDKDVDICINTLYESGMADPKNVYCIEATHPRALSRTELQGIINLKYGIEQEVVTAVGDRQTNISDTLMLAMRDATTSSTSSIANNEGALTSHPQQVIVAFGSAYIMSDLKIVLDPNGQLSGKYEDWKAIYDDK